MAQTTHPELDVPEPAEDFEDVDQIAFTTLPKQDAAAEASDAAPTAPADQAEDDEAAEQPAKRGGIGGLFRRKPKHKPGHIQQPGHPPLHQTARP